jgi:hypothetical protein
LRLAFPLVLIVGVAVARAGAVGGTVALVGTLFGLATVAATAIGAPPLLTGFGVASAPALSRRRRALPMACPLPSRSSLPSAR